ncbi:hypothetical protein [Cerasicoccus fimbriatus]|uniref:hypothetical protein n=1 Tax=Cerasicoccus fimbriatus TaxID=3014554 RepID=UPI0022B2D134|nr:hypothetical protein [Cerasicoccus sp. TK19100]
MPPHRLFACLASAFAALALSTPSVFATQVIANWDVVPGQMIDAPFKVGVVAFHETGANVDFKVNGAAVASVDDPTWNDRTGVWEYWFELDPADYADGPLTVAATANTDGAGESRTLTDLTLYANSNGSLTNSTVVWLDWENGDDGNPGTEASPKKSINAGVQAAGDGGTVYLKASENYKLTNISGGAFTYWTTVSAAPGLDADDVKILTYGASDSTGRFSKSGIRWKNVAMYCDPGPGYSNIFYINNGQRVWFDGCWLYDKNGRWNGTTAFNNQGGVTYLTNSKITDVNNSGGSFHRNMSIERIGSDIYRVGSGLVAINVKIRTMDKGDTAAHPDFIQLYNPNDISENVILYNIECYDMLAQGFFGGAGTAQDVALVNIILEKDPPNSALMSQMSGLWKHILFWNITEADQTFNFRNSADMEDIYVQNCVFSTFIADNQDNPAFNITHAHTKALNWNQTETLGENATLGDPQFVDYDNDNYRLLPTSPAYGTGSLPPGVPADVNGVPYDPESPNRGVFAKANTGEKKKPLAEHISVQVTPNGDASDIHATLVDSANGRYQIESSADLVHWTPGAILFSDDQGRVITREKLIPQPTRRFYRLRRIDYPHVDLLP